MNKNLEDFTLKEITDGLTGECYPYGSETYDHERYNNLILKGDIVFYLVDEIMEAGKLYNRSEFSILRISNKANEVLTDLRDWLCEIDHLPPREEIEEDE